MVSIVKAEIIRGRFVDAETKEALEGVDLLCTGAYRVNGIDKEYFTHIATDSLGRFLFFSNKSGKISAKLIGYYPKEMEYLAISNTERDTLDLGDIKMKVSEVMMKALIVKERARRFTLSGDTIVFHPEAFHLEKGARLEELIAQLPGVEMNGSSLYFNGKPIRVVMNGESLFGNSDFYRKLPAEAVETIKAYNKASEFSERTGKEDGKEDMVLDLKIKKSFLDKFYGEINGAYQTKKHYDANVDVHKLSESNPIMITTSANNLNLQRHSSMGSSSGNRSKGFGQQQYGAAGYQRNWRRTEDGQTLRSLWSVSGGMAHNDRWDRTRQDTENFFPDEEYNYTATSNYNRNHTLNPNAEARIRTAINTKNTVNVFASFDHSRTRNRSDYRSAQFGCDPYELWAQPLTASFDSLSPGLLLRNRTQSASEGHSTTINANTDWTHYIKDGSLTLTASMNFNEAESDWQTQRYIEYFTDDRLTTMLHQSSHTPDKSLKTNVMVSARKWVHKNVLLEAAYLFNDIRTHSSQDFFENNVYSKANSYDERHTTDSHAARIGTTISLNSLKLMPTMSLTSQHENLDYRRGSIDTTATRHAMLWQPKLKTTWKMNKMSSLELNYSLDTAQPKIVETIHYRDDSDPLYIREGNPNLYNAHNNDISLAFSCANGKRQRMISCALGFHNSDRTIQYVQTYNPGTSVYTVHPEMVRGNRQGSASFNLDQGLGNQFRLKNNMSLQYGRSYGYLTHTDDTKALQLNQCNSFAPSEAVTLSYDHVWLKSSLSTSVAMNQMRFSKAPQQNTTTWRETIKADFTVDLELFTVSTNLTEYLRHGYLISNMNNNYLLWNASATWKFHNNKARLKLEVNDILNQIDTFYAQQSAYQNIYSWREQMHHYINISFTYHFDAKAKK